MEQWPATPPEWNGSGAALACRDAEVAYDDGSAARVPGLIGDEAGLVEQKTFGGLAMMLNGNVAVGVHGDSLIELRGDQGPGDDVGPVGPPSSHSRWAAS
jgi:hypothetical protein